MIPLLLRACAIAIAIAGILDPSFTSTRRTKLVVSVVAADPATDAALAGRVASELRGDFTVIEAPFDGAAGTVVVGRRLPRSASRSAAAGFVIIPEPDRPGVTLEAVTAPARVPLEASVPVAVRVRVTGASGRRVRIELRNGDLAADSTTQDVAGDDERLDVTLAFVPAAAGVTPLRVVAQVEDAGGAAHADLLVDVHDARSAVLFFDARATWMSTFVRRALERDPRFDIASRIVTSRGISTDAGQPPASLADATALATFDAIVVGAPEALSERDVAGLEHYLRVRGGAVVLLFDRHASGPYERLTEVREWAEASPSGGIGVTRDRDGLRAGRILWPAPLPAGARPLAIAKVDSARADLPVIWTSASGAGRLIVSGALDAWRSRDPATSHFDAFWRTLVAEAAAATPAAIDIALDQAMLRPGESTDVTVTLRAQALAPASDAVVHASIAAALEGPNGRSVLRLWPDGSVGRFRGVLRAPPSPGTYRVIVSASGARADAALIVANDLRHAVADEPDLLAAWAAARGGTVIPAARINELPAALEAALTPAPRRVTWHPMRSAWWILPFALALAAEWWHRRRRGLA